jgi:hypothetical protein
MARGSARALTTRDCFWLEHLRAIARSAETATGYTRRNGLSRGALWQAQRRLEKLGAWTRSRKRARETAGAETRVSFARVAVQGGSAPAAGAVRLRVAPGVELEWSTPPQVEILAALIERLAARA